MGIFVQMIMRVRGPLLPNHYATLMVSASKRKPFDLACLTQA